MSDGIEDPEEREKSCKIPHFTSWEIETSADFVACFLRGKSRGLRNLYGRDDFARGPSALGILRL